MAKRDKSDMLRKIKENTLIFSVQNSIFSNWGFSTKKVTDFIKNFPNNVIYRIEHFIKRKSIFSPLTPR